LANAGIWFGDTKEGDDYNINGYYENLGITSLIVQYLKMHDKDNLGKRFHPLGLASRFHGFRKNVENIIVSQGYVCGDWFYKDPKIAFCWRMMAYYFPNAKWVIVRRDREQVISSCMRTPFMDAYHTRAEWGKMLDRYDSLTNEIQKYADSHVFDINKAMEDTDEVQKLLKYACKENKLFDALMAIDRRVFTNEA
jgi:hypothetical protein